MSRACTHKWPGVKLPCLLMTHRRHEPRVSVTQNAESLRLRAGELDHLGPLLCFRIDKITEISGRHRRRRATKIDKTSLELRIIKCRVDLFVQLLDNRGRRILRCPDPEPCRRLVAWQKFV